jgi:hypothetical protein
VEINTQQIINFRAILQAQIAKAIAALGMKDIRELRGQYDRIQWSVLEERVKNRRCRRADISRPTSEGQMPAPSDCGVAAIVSNHFIPSHVRDLMLDRMANRGMDGVGVWKGGCYPHLMDHYALHILIKGTLQPQLEEESVAKHPEITLEEVRRSAREEILVRRRGIMREILDRYLKGLQIEDFDGDLEKFRVPYRHDQKGE